jgi:hypothetical protein
LDILIDSAREVGRLPANCMCAEQYVGGPKEAWWVFRNISIPTSCNISIGRCKLKLFTSRLSDFFFVGARYASHHEKAGEVIYKKVRAKETRKADVE